MPEVAASGRSSRRGRRSMSDINMVPFIDVMLVLLIIFMVSAPLITTSLIDVPSVGKAKNRPAHVIEVMVDRNAQLRWRIDGGDVERVALDRLAARVTQAQGGDAQVPVVISADHQVRYEQVVKVMDTLQRAGVQRVGLTVKQAS